MTQILEASWARYGGDCFGRRRLRSFKRRGTFRDVASRAVDVVSAVLILIVTLPVWTLAMMMLAVRGRIFVATTHVGLAGHNVWQAFLRAGWRRWNIENFPVLFNVLVGDMALVGPRPITLDEHGAAGRDGRKRTLVRPGLVCLWWIRRRANIAYGSEIAADLEYIGGRSLGGDLAILLRALMAGLYGCSKPAANHIRLFDLPIDNITMTDAVERIVAQTDQSEPRQVCFVNADCVNLSFGNSAYRSVLQSAWMVLPDGVGMKLAGRAFGRDVRENLCGTDVFISLCQALAGTGKKVFLLGGRPGVAERVVGWIERNHPGVNIAGVHHGYFTADEEPGVIRQIADTGAAYSACRLWRRGRTNGFASISRPPAFGWRSASAAYSTTTLAASRVLRFGSARSAWSGCFACIRNPRDCGSVISRAMSSFSPAWLRGKSRAGVKCRPRVIFFTRSVKTTLQALLALTCASSTNPL